MPLFLQLALALAILITAAKVGGYLSLRLGQPAVLGSLLAGLILGPLLLDFLHWGPFSDIQLGETIHCLAELGVLLLMFIAGLDLHLSDLAKSGKAAVLVGTMGVILPVVMGYGLGRALSMAAVPAIFIGLILAATSVSISAQTLMELKILRSRVGVTLLGAAVFDDILVVLGLSILVALTDSVTGGLASVGLISLRMLSYLIVASVLGLWLLPKMSQRVDRLPISQGLVAFSFVTILLYAWAAEVWGNMAAITGAFLAGVLLARSPLRERIQSGISTLAYSIFVPIFFTNIGLLANAGELTVASIGLALAMIGVAILSKVLGAGFGARLGGFSNRAAIQLGVGMMSRGEVGLIVASFGMAKGIISAQVFSAMVGVVIATTLLTPPILRALFARDGVPVSQITLSESQE
jgi:Kef-type K+ transport system membrane component KefB